MARRSRTTRRRDRLTTTAPRRDRWRLAVFLAAVFVVKLVVVSQLYEHPLLAPDAGLDSESYVQLARRVLGGDLLLGPGLYFLSPLYIYFLAAVLALSDSFLFVRVVQAALGTAAVGFVFVAARLWFGRRAAWIAAALAAATGVLTFFEIVIMQSALDTVLTAAALAALAAALFAPGAPEGEREAPRWVTGSRGFLASGLVFGLQILNRPNVGLAAGGVFLGLLLIRRYRAAALVAAGICAALLPIVVRNAIVARQFAMVSSQGGLNFYIGNNANATGQYEAVPGVRANIEGQAEDTRKVAESAVGHSLTDAQVSAYFTDRAVTWIRAHPARAARLLARKVALTFSARHQWLDFSYPYYAYDTGSMLWLLAVGPWLLVPLGAVGLLFAAPAGRRPEFYVWASFLPWYAVGVAVFFVAERYRLPIFVPLAIGAGGALARAGEWVRARQIAPAAVLLAALVVTLWPFEVPDGRFEERLRLSKVLMNRRDYGGAAAELQAALALRPNDTVTQFSLGMALTTAGRPDEGVALIRRAVDAGVPIEGARYVLVNTLLRTGDVDGAVRLLRSYTPAPTDSAESCFHVATLAIEAGAPDVAARYLRRALELRPGWPEAQQALAQLRQ